MAAQYEYKPGKRSSVVMERDVSFYSGPGLKLVGIVNTSSGYKEQKDKRLGIVLCHGLCINRGPEVMTKGFLSIRPILLRAQSGLVV